MAAINPGVTASDRLSFTVFLAIALHAVIILGVTFTTMKLGPTTHTMEITLAQQRTRNRPEKADFLAQFNQSGSGTLAERALTTTPNKSEFHDTLIRKTSPLQQAPEAIMSKRKLTPVLTTTNKSIRQTATQIISNKTDPTDIPVKGQKSLLQRSLEIASLEARYDRQKQIYAKRPRIKRLTSLSTASSNDAYYLNSWRRKIERIGNLNYPSEARKRKLFGSLRLMVAILPDGSLKEVILLESSGHRVLDDAAIRIVKLASPFAPFPDAMRRSTDELEIIRTWQFRKNSSLRSY